MQLTNRFEWRGRDVAWGSAGSGPPVVFCHGTPWSSELWAPFADALADDFAVYLWDMPGYGQSSKSQEHAVDLSTQGELLRDLLVEWNLSAPHVVAHDYGGAVALRAALIHGCVFESLALVDVVALRPWGSPFFSLVKSNSDVFAALPPDIHRGVLKSYIGGAAFRELRSSDLDMLMSPWLGADGQSAFYRQIAQADEKYTSDFESQLSALDVPVRIVWGADDAWIPMDRAQRLHATIPGSTLTLVPDAGHLIQLDAPVALASILRSWLSSRGQRR